MDADVLIIGAGAAGLMAGYELAQKNISVMILEARSRPGGRIHTITAEEFPGKAEGGAEFIHGNLPNTLALLKAAGIAYSEAGGEMYTLANGSIQQRDNFSEHWKEIKKKLQELENDMPVAAFMEIYFPGAEYVSVRDSIRSFVEGFDSADTRLASTFAFRNEWLKEINDDQYRVSGGYGNLVNYLCAEIQKRDGKIEYDVIARQVDWEKGRVKVISINGNIYTAKRLLITIPVSILRNETATASLLFNPAIPQKMAAINQLGFGDVIKVLLYCKQAFWEDGSYNLKEAGFIFTSQPIPTWWTQFPEPSLLFTGWLAGPKAAALSKASDDEIATLALESLASAFNKPMHVMEEMVSAKKIMNWSNDIFTQGAYAFSTPESKTAVAILSEPELDTIFFAGDAIYEGPGMGTVEAALTSGKNAAKRIAAVME